MTDNFEVTKDIDLIFSLRGISKSHTVSEGFCLQIEALDIARGEMLAITGPSGCGKSTTLDILATTLEADTVNTSSFYFMPLDTLKVNLLDLWQNSKIEQLAKLRAKYLSYILQTGGLLPFLTAADNISYPNWFKEDNTEYQQRITDLINRLDIADKMQQYPATLSVGERQRVAFVKALSHSPAVILADEPTAALDPLHAQDMLNILVEMAKIYACTIVLVTHVFRCRLVLR